jgi:molybdate transport system ATP-binding protein
MSSPPYLASWRGNRKIPDPVGRARTLQNAMTMRATKPFLELAGVSLRINDRLAFRNTHWNFARNQNWALVGPNASGKTLLSRALAGELPLAKGEILCGFRAPAGRIPEDCIVLVSFEQQRALAGDAPPAARWFSLEQEAAPSVEQFLSQDSVEEINPFEVRKRSPESSARFDRLRRSVASLLKIESLISRSLPSLSNGEMRKILLAHALLKRPKLLILDDVFTGLDAGFRVHLKSVLERLMARKATRILLIDSRPTGLPRGITHMLFVDRCRVVAQGARGTMMRHPRVQQLLSSTRAPSKRRNPSVFPHGKRNHVRQKLVRMENVSVQYNGRQVLSGINWTVCRGESWALVGPNGSGKSTLLSLISGDNPQAYANSIYLFGRRRGSGESVWDLKKRIGWVSSELHLHFPEDQTCLETVISGFRESTACYRRPSSQERKAARRTLERFGIGSLHSSCFGSLSTGLQQMILLARSLVKSPDLLLLDEPCQALDLAHRGIFLSMIESLLCGTDITIVYVTHIYEEIPKGLHKVLILRDGRVVRSGIIPKSRDLAGTLCE